MGCVYSNENSSGSSKKKNSSNGGNNTNSNGDVVNGDPNAGSGPERRTSGDSSNPNNNATANCSNRHRIYDVEVCNVEKEGTIHGQLEITDTNLIYRLKGRSPIIWPLRFLRSYGHDKDIFSFECGRRCPTGEGVYVFKCSKAEQLFRTLLDVINNATTLNASNGAINNSGPQAHSSLAAAGSLNSTHEYQNLAPFEGGSDVHGNFGTLPSRLPNGSNAGALSLGLDTVPRPHSSMGHSSSEVTHTYLNSSGLVHHHPLGQHSHHQHVIRGDSLTGGGGKSTTPNYYSTNSPTPPPTSCHNCCTTTSSSSGHFFHSQHSVGSVDGSKSSLNGNGSGRRSSASNNRDCFDSSTLPPMSSSGLFSRTSAKGPSSLTHERKNSEHHLYENHEVPKTTAASNVSTISNSTATASRLRKLEQISSKMTPSDDLSTFCYVNLSDGVDSASVGGTASSRRAQERLAFLQASDKMSIKSARTTPEPRLSYIQLDLKSTPSTKETTTTTPTTTTSTTKSESLKGGDKLEKTLSSSSSSAIILNGKQLINGLSARVRKGSGGSLSSFTPSAPVPSSSSSVATISTTVPVLKEYILENASSASTSTVPAAAVAAASVPYAQIDFAKTLALSNSAANHRKL